MVLTELGKSFGKVEKVAVLNIAVPTPSDVRSKKQTRQNAHVEGIDVATL